MISQKIECDRCGADVGDKGFSVTFSADNSLGIDILAGANIFMERHYCGKQCLMLALNEIVDHIETEEKEVKYA